MIEEVFGTSFLVKRFVHRYNERSFVLMKKKLLILIVCICLLPLTTVYAVSNLGTLSYWHAHHEGSEYAEIARWSNTPNTKHYYLSGFSNESAFLSHVNFARNAWRDAGISINSTSSDSNATFKIYGGTLADISNYQAGLSPTYDGYCDFSHSSLEGTWNYNGKQKYGLLQHSVKVYIIHKGNLGNQHYNNVTLHEMAHGLGWRAHSTNTSDVMYGFLNQRPTTLTKRDKEHLKQVYP